MNWIEIIGPYGVGKSTLLKALSTQRNDKKHEWVFPDEAIIEIAKNTKRQILPGNQK